MEKPVKWGVLGAAWIACQRVIPAMQSAPGCEVLAIAARDGDRARAVAGQLGIERAYDSYEALLADPDIEAVYMPLPNPMHVPWGLKALEAGKHVLCEKPIAMNAAEAEQLVGAQARYGRFVEEAFPFPNHPQWDFIRQTAASGEIGRVRAVTAVGAYQNTKPDDLRNQPAMGGGGLYDMGCYLINGCRIAFREEPVRVVGLFDMDPDLGIDRLTSAILEFPSGHATITVSTQAGPTTGGSHQHLGILAEHGWMRADFPFSHSTPSLCHVYLGDTNARGGIPTREVEFPVVNQYALQAERFSRRVRGEAVEAWPIEHAVANMRVIDALFRSGRSGGWERV